MHGVPGWYGKLPSLSDFASRRLPPAFIEPWDDWLADALAAWRVADPAWLDAYLAAPTLCFVLGPSALAVGGREPPGPAWAGVLMPSVDRVGRYFPLTIASPVPGLSELAAPRLVHWLRHTAERAADALHQDWSPARLDEALVELGELTWPHFGRDDDAGDFALALRRTARQGAGTLWWLPGATGEERFREAEGLPDRDAFIRLLTAAPDAAP